MMNFEVHAKTDFYKGFFFFFFFGNGCGDCCGFLANGLGDVLGVMGQVGEKKGLVWCGDDQVETQWMVGLTDFFVNYVLAFFDGNVDWNALTPNDTIQKRKKDNLVNSRWLAS